MTNIYLPAPVAASGSMFPDQGWNLGPLHWKHGVLATGPLGKSFANLFNLMLTILPSACNNLRIITIDELLVERKKLKVSLRKSLAKSNKSLKYLLAYNKFNLSNFALKKKI